MADLSDFEVLSFDCYGTLIDWETGIWDAFQPVLMENGRDDISRAALLEAFAEEESRLEREHPSLPYDRILQMVHAGLRRRFGLAGSGDMDAAFGASLPHWPAFPDTAEALRLLKRRFRLVILSNVHREGFAASNRKLGVRFDAVLTAQDIGSYKPDPANFRHLVTHVRETWGLAPERILHVAQSMFHDHVPAARAGLARIWIDRQGLSEGGPWGATARVDKLPEPLATYPDLASFAAAAVGP